MLLGRKITQVKNEIVNGQEALLTEDALGNGRGLHPDGAVGFAGAIDGAAEELGGDAAAAAVRGGDEGVDDEAVGGDVAGLAVAGAGLEFRGEDVAGLMGGVLEEFLGGPNGEVVEGKFWYEARGGWDHAVGDEADEVSGVSGHGEAELDGVYVDAVVEDLLDVGPYFFSGVHELDGFVEFEGVRDHVGQGKDTGVLGRVDFDFHVLEPLRDASHLVVGKALTKSSLLYSQLLW